MKTSYAVHVGKKGASVQKTEEDEDYVSVPVPVEERIDGVKTTRWETKRVKVKDLQK